MSSETPTYYDLVYELVSLIPEGRVTTYGLIADYLSLGSARMVGYALRQIPPMLDIPAHRVVNHAGHLTGRAHFDPPERMADLLIQESIIVIDNRVQQLGDYLWIPSRDL